MRAFLFTSFSYFSFPFMNVSQLYDIFRKHPLVSTDTRKIIPGSIFFALSGEHFDGNQFAFDAISKGAAYAVLSDSSLIHDQFIHVDDTLKALQSLAKIHRSIFQIPHHRNNRE